MNTEPAGQTHGISPGLARRDFLKVGAGFSMAVAVAGALGTLGGCGEAAKAPAKSFAFLQDADIAMVTALVPVVITDVARLDAAQRAARVGDVMRNLDGTLAALDQGSQKELRKLFDLLAIAPLRYLLAGVGAWSEADVPTLEAFLARWRGSRLATLNAGGNAIVKLISAGYYVLPVSWPATGYPGPLERVYKAVNA